MSEKGNAKTDKGTRSDEDDEACDRCGGRRMDRSPGGGIGDERDGSAALAVERKGRYRLRGVERRPRRLDIRLSRGEGERSQHCNRPAHAHWRRRGAFDVWRAREARPAPHDVAHGHRRADAPLQLIHRHDACRQRRDVPCGRSLRRPVPEVRQTGVPGGPQAYSLAQRVAAC